MHRCTRLAIAVLILAGLSAVQGCAGTPQSDKLRTDPPAGLARSAELNEVPFFPQQAYQCGPASLAMILNHQHVAVAPRELTPKLYVPEKKGSLQIELVSNTRQYGLIPYQLDSAMTDLLKEVEAGNPVLVLQNLALEWYPQWHYAVLVGYDLGAEQVVLRSGRHRRHINSFSLFERTWARADRWALVVLQPGQLPATAEYWRYLKAVAAMEKVRQYAAAQAGYRAGLDKWPDDQRLLMGLSNTLYAMGKLEQAARRLQRLVETHPDYAPAYNNLAQIRAEQGRLEQAERDAIRAVELGGDHSATYRQTLRDIRDRHRPAR